MKTFMVFYVKPTARVANMLSPVANPSHYEYVATVDAQDLEALWREMNVVDGDELPVILKKRSMMMGDVVIDINANTAHACAAMGWKTLEDDTRRGFHDLALRSVKF